MRPARVLLAALAACAMTLQGCGGAAENNEAETESPKGVTAVDYTTRGVVAQLPSDNDPTSEFFVRHEAIPDFRASLPDGPLGMNAMTMPFPLLRGVTLDGLEVGDKISLTFRVDYDEKTGAIQGYRVISFEELPADTELVFSSPGEP